jgi:hypothetical protein
MKMSERDVEGRKPKPGEPYLDGEVYRMIREVGRQYDDGGWAVVLDNGVGYDCYWHAEKGVWQYWPPEEQ